MTVINSAARPVNQHFIRPAPKPTNITLADSAPAAKLIKSKPVGDVASPRFHSASIKASQVTKPGVDSLDGDIVTKRVFSASINASSTTTVDTPPSSAISGDLPAPPSLDVEIQKAMDAALLKFEKDGGGSHADLQRVLYNSVWNTLQDAGETNTPVKAALAVNDYIEHMNDNEGTKNGGSASIVGPAPIDGETPTISSAGYRVSSLDIRI